MGCNQSAFSGGAARAIQSFGGGMSRQSGCDRLDCNGGKSPDPPTPTTESVAPAKIAGAVSVMLPAVAAHICPPPIVRAF
jgi:hypothetical protein